MKFFLPGVLLIFLIAVFLLSGPVQPSFAQNTCDLCGACNGSKPPDYDECVSCLYENPDDPPTMPKAGYSWTVIGCISTSPEGFVQSGIRFITVTVGGIMFVVLLYGSFLLLTSSGEPEKLSQGKSLVVSAIIALTIILFSVFILQFIGETLLKIPGFGEG